jgi:hypothetical protein
MRRRRTESRNAACTASRFVRTFAGRRFVKEQVPPADHRVGGSLLYNILT